MTTEPAKTRESIALVQERMTAGEARAVVERADSDDKPEREDDASFYEYAAARRVLAKERE